MTWSSPGRTSGRRSDRWSEMVRAVDRVMTTRANDLVPIPLQPPRAMLLLLSTSLLVPSAIAGAVYVICVDHRAWPVALALAAVAAPAAIRSFRLASQRARLLPEGASSAGRGHVAT